MRIIVIPEDGTGTCHSQKERENAHLTVKYSIKDTSANIIFIPECGDGLWYRVAYLNMTDPTQQCPLAWRLYNISGDGLWYRVAYLNMTDPTQQCPLAWRLYNTRGVRAGGRPTTSGSSCSATFHTLKLVVNTTKCVGESSVINLLHLMHLIHVQAAWTTTMWMELA